MTGTGRFVKYKIPLIMEIWFLVYLAHLFFLITLLICSPIYLFKAIYIALNIT